MFMKMKILLRNPRGFLYSKGQYGAELRIPMIYCLFQNMAPVGVLLNSKVTRAVPDVGICSALFILTLALALCS